jgi:(2R)-ethylmalonyl-CoA mutase
MEIHYAGIRLTPAEIVAQAIEHQPHVLGLSILSGSHLSLVSDALRALKAAGMAEVPVVVGGIIPEEDATALGAMGVARVYTPKDFELNRIMADIVDLAAPQVAAAE